MAGDTPIGVTWGAERLDNTNGIATSVNAILADIRLQLRVRPALYQIPLQRLRITMSSHI